MWVYFNQYGVNKTQLVHGTPARQGQAGAFSIYCYFENVTVTTSTATVTFERPDGTIIGTTYGMTRMTGENSKFHKLEGEFSTGDFVDGTEYPGFIINVNDVGITAMAGNNKATIKVSSGSTVIVQGLINFYVEPAVAPESYSITTTQYNAIQSQLAQKAYIEDIILSVSSISDVSAYEDGQLLYYNKNVYVVVESNNTKSAQFVGTIDSYTKSESDTTFLKLSGGTLTGNVTFSTDYKKLSWPNCYITGTGDEEFVISILNDFAKYHFEEDKFYASKENDLGSSSNKFKDLYLSGSLKDGTNSIAVSNIQTKLPNASASGKVLKSTNTTGGIEWGDVGATNLENGTGTGSVQIIASGNLANNTPGEYSASFGVTENVYGEHSMAAGAENTIGASGEVKGYNSFAFGVGNTVTGHRSFAQGSANTVTSDHSFAEGGSNTVSAGFGYGHAEGQNNQVLAACGHAEGNSNIVASTAGFAHVEGQNNTCSADYSHAEGYYTTASHVGSHSGGYHTQTGKSYQTTIGEYNVGRNNTLFEVGNGSDNNNRSNAFEVYSDGSAKINNKSVATTDLIHITAVDFTIE